MRCDPCRFVRPGHREAQDSPIEEVILTDTIPLSKEKTLDKITVLSIAPLLLRL